MSYHTPPHRKDAVLQVLEVLASAHRVILTTHVNADGDGCGSEVALAAWLRARGSEAWIVNPTPYPEAFRFMVPDPEWVLDAGSGAAADACRGADLAVVLDTGEVSRIGRVKPMIDPLPRAVVDHHPPGPDRIAGISFRDPGACATGELVYDLIQAAGGPWEPVVVEGIYVAVMTDTGSFRFSNATADCHRIAADLIERGIEPEALHRQVYGSVAPRALHLLRASLGELGVHPDGGVAWMTVPRRAFVDLGAGPDDLEGLVDYPRAIRGVEVGILFRSLDDGATKVSLRSNGAVDVNEIARRFGGGGHVKAAGARVSRPLAEVREEVVEATAEAVRRQWAGRGDGSGGPAARSEAPSGEGTV